MLKIHLENILLGILFLILLIYSGFMMSCAIPGVGSDTFSTSSDDDDDDDDVDVAEKRRDSSRDRRPCENRDSCQDSCDYMFRNSRSRSACYNLTFDDVSDLEIVFDELHSSSISKRSLEDIDVSDFEDFIALDVDGWVNIIVGEEGKDHDDHEAYSSQEARAALEWIAENENVSRAIIDKDEHYDILYHLLLQFNKNTTGTLKVSSPDRYSLFGSGKVKWCSDGIDFDSTCGSGNFFSLGDSVREFALSFIGANNTLKFDGKSYISYAYDEDNEEAVELAHESLVRFCEDGTGKELSHLRVQRCMLAAYCSIRDNEKGNANDSLFDDDIFDDVLSDYGADPEDCALAVIRDNNGDDLEDLFN